MRYALLPALALVALVFSCKPTVTPPPDSGDAMSSDAAAMDATPPPPPAPSASAPMPTAGAPAQRLTMVNSCQYPIWVQQQGMPSGTPAVIQIGQGAKISYDIPAAGLASTRFWPKLGCDSSGNNCAMGQSSPPCPAKGCPPPVDSKLEATWGCLFSDPSKCASTPQGNKIDMTTWWNASAVDGYTLPYTITATGGDGRKACSNVDCSGLTAAGCPTDDDLSTGGKYPQYKSQNENVKGSSPTWAGCFSTCSKLTYPTYGGDGVQPPQDPKAQMYCCPTPPVSSPQCVAGPVPKTKFVAAVHAMCKNTVYGYAYDDTVGLRQCSSNTVFTMTFGPGCP